VIRVRAKVRVRVRAKAKVWVRVGVDLTPNLTTCRQRVSLYAAVNG
jgi:hypothetical protein